MPHINESFYRACYEQSFVLKRNITVMNGCRFCVLVRRAPVKH